jgi:cytochrome P450
MDLSLQLPAGTETSISTIRGIMLYLMTTPTVYHKLKLEIADAIHAGQISTPIKPEEAKRLPYLQVSSMHAILVVYTDQVGMIQAVINEGMRMIPPLVGGFGKRVPPGGDVICGLAIPEGTEVHANFLAMMRDEDVFGQDADIFRPERFIECDLATQSRRLKVVDLNFGYGRWLCLGKALAWMEMNKIFVEVSA